MDDFKLTEDSLLEFYHLKTLNPTTSWEQDSSLQFNLAKWQDQCPTPERAYEVLKDLIEQQQGSEESRAREQLDDRALARVNDPLSNESMLALFNYYHIEPQDRWKYLVNSKRFDAKAFLKNMHNRDTFEDLSRSLDKLDATLQDQADELKEMVQQNFGKYVRVKSRLDQIYKQFAAASVQGAGAESHEFLGVDQLSDRVDDSVRVTTLKLKPLLDTSEKIKNYNTTIKFVEENRSFFDAPKILKEYLEKKDYSSLMVKYATAKDGYLGLIKLFQQNQSQPEVPKVVHIIWEQIESVIDIYRNETWSLLLNLDNNTNGAGFNDSIDDFKNNEQYFLPLISKLLDLEVKENPILKWIETYLNSFENEATKISQEMATKVEEAKQSILKNINASESDSIEGVELVHYLSINQLFNSNVGSNDTTQIGNSMVGFHGLIDSSTIVGMWLLILKYIKMLEKTSMAFIEFWENVEKFLNGNHQNTIINEKKKEDILGGDGSTLDTYKYLLQIEEKQVRQIRAKGENFITLISHTLLLFFQPSERSFNQGKNKSADGSESILSYGFVPPKANGLSCLRYLPKIIDPILKFTTELAQLAISESAGEKLRTLAAMILERCVGAISAVKLRDISNFHRLEDWQVYETVQGKNDEFVEYGVTQFPQIACRFQEFSIKTVRDILFAFEKLPVLNGISIVDYPSKKLLANVELQQVISMEAVLEAILKNAAQYKDNPRTSQTILILTNLQDIRENVFPQVLQYFDYAFECELSKKNLELFNLLAKMESSIFGNYLSELKINLRDSLEAKFREINWPAYTSNSFRVSDYLVEALMLLVTVHSECFRIGPQLIDRILSESQVFISKYLFEAYKSFVGAFSQDGLLQATVDICFFQKVLGDLVERDAKITLMACLQNCFQNNNDKMERTIKETEPIVNANIRRTSVQFAAFKQQHRQQQQGETIDEQLL